MNRKLAFLTILLLIGLMLSGCVAFGGYGYYRDNDYGYGYHGDPYDHHYYNHGYSYQNHHRDWGNHYH